MSTTAMNKAIAEYFKTQPVLKAWLFGSFSRGEERPESDVDILVDLDYSHLISLRFFGMYEDPKKLPICHGTCYNGSIQHVIPWQICCRCGRFRKIPHA